MNTNRKYKDSVFTKLFGEKENLLELYNAIENTNYGKDTEIEIATLDDVLYMEQMNDIAFIIDGKIVVLIEHQSTINPNMPLRMLLYVARVYEKITESDNLYSNNEISLARPEFIVLYNGKDEFPDKKTYELSEMFNKHGLEKPINLELVVQVYNINDGRNPEFAARSKTLSGYEKFIGTITEYAKTMSREEAMKKAVDECIKRNILRSFLETNATEVINMLLKEWNMDDALRVRERDGIQKGIQQGMQQGMQQMLNLLKSGVSFAEAEKMLKTNLIKM
jgi:predicted transposase/invertase (TIGR01784 family)